MRKWNNLLARIIIGVMLVHAMMGSLMMMGLSSVSFRALSWILLGLVGIHGVLGILSTLQALKNGRKSGSWYLRQNAAYWTKRFSGLAILILLGFHVTAFAAKVGDAYFLKEFTCGRMAALLLLIGAIFLHLAVSVKSMLIAKGTLKFKERTVDWMMVLSLLMLFFAAAVVIYFIQWQR